MVFVRAADVTDAPACSIVLVASITSLCVADHNNDKDVIDQWIANKTSESLASWIANPHHTFVVAEHGNCT